MTASSDRIQVAFVCVQNAGRSQMASAFARREVADRGLPDEIEIVTGGTEPADEVHDVVVDAMAEVGIDVANRAPREITRNELASCDLVITMGCTADEVCPAGWGGETRDWDLDDPHGKSVEDVRQIRDEIGRRVAALFDELDDRSTQ